MKNTSVVNELLGENGLKKFIHILRKRVSSFLVSFFISGAILLGLFLLIGYNTQKGNTQKENSQIIEEEFYLSESEVYVLPVSKTILFSNGTGIESSSIDITYGEELLDKDVHLYKLIENMDLDTYFNQRKIPFSHIPIAEILEKTKLLIKRTGNKVVIQVSNSSEKFSIDLANAIAFQYQQTLTDFVQEMQIVPIGNTQELLKDEFGSLDEISSILSTRMVDNISIFEVINPGKILQIIPASVVLSNFENGFNNYTPTNPMETETQSLFNNHMAVVAILLGFLLALAYILVLEQMDNKIYEIDQLHKQCKKAFLGWIPFFKNKAVKEAIVTQASDEHIEQKREISYKFQIIANNLLRLNTSKSKIIAVTSPHNLEGKTLSVNYITHALVERGYKVLILDAASLIQTKKNITFGHRKIFNISECYSNGSIVPGFFSSLLDQASIQPVLAIDQDDLHFLEKNTSEAATIIEELRMNFDYIFIDAPPLLGSLEFSMISDFIDGMLLVVRAGFTSDCLLKVCLDTINGMNIKLIGTIFNGVIPELTYYDSETYCWWKARNKLKKNCFLSYKYFREFKTINSYKKLRNQT